jgi:flagellin
MALEMTNFTKLQVLQQSGVAMLGQANQAPNAVLSLIRG